MKLTIAVTLALALFTFSLIYAQNRTPAVPANPGRFQIVSAEYAYLGKQATLKQSGVFRINTETGQTWIYTSLEDDKGKLLQEWTPIR